MKLSCTQENLNQGLSVVGRIARPQATLPVLSNVLLKTEGGRLKIAATDLELGVNCYIGAKVEKEGAVTIPARLLIDYVMMNNDKKINLEASTTEIDLKSDRYKAKIKGIGASEFPLIPSLKEKPIISLPSTQFKEAISQVLIAPTPDETKPTLSGICFKMEKKELKMVATDSFRLAEKKLTLDKEVEKKEIIVPSRTLSEISRILSLIAPSSVSITISSNQVLFTLDNVQIISKIIEGSFPDYEPIIPKETETKATLETPDFQHSLKMANLFTKDTGGNVKLKFEKDKLIVSATSSLLGEHISTIASSSEGPEVEITFNVKFILDVLSVISSSKIKLGVSGKLSPSVIKPVGSSDYLYLIMPLRTEE